MPTWLWAPGMCPAADWGLRTYGKKSRAQPLPCGALCPEKGQEAVKEVIGARVQATEEHVLRAGGFRQQSAEEGTEAGQQDEVAYLTYPGGAKETTHVKGIAVWGKRNVYPEVVAISTRVHLRHLQSLISLEYGM